MSRKIFLLSLIFWGLIPWLANANTAMRFGHNLSATSSVLRSGECTFGLQLIGCGLNDRLTLGTSTWMLQGYKLANVGLRHIFKKDDQGNVWAAEIAYFKNYGKISNREYSKRPYEMEAWWLRWIRTYQVTPHYRLHLNLHTNYYADDEMPFSLRRPIPNRNNGQINVSTLHEVELLDRWFLSSEMGFLDLVQPAQYIHVGTAIGRTGENYHWHIGYSMSATIRSLFAPTKRADYQQELRETTQGYNTDMNRDKARRDYSIHPEFALQYFF